MNGSAEQFVPVTTKPIETPALHLAFIDGMRGFAAFYVVLHHAFQGSNFKIDSQSPIWFWLFYHGHAMVTVFIAISGFCLMAPVARNGLVFRKGSAFFFKKRAHRILPPYYVALGLAILADVLSHPSGTRWEYLHNPLTSLAIWTHLLLIHNWFLAPVLFSFDGPLWSVATECQIYLFFPLMVLSWKRFGAVRTLATICILAHAIFYATGHRAAVNYFFTFALGMAGAQIAVSGKVERWLHWACGLGFAGYLLNFIVFNDKDYLADICTGVFTASLMALLSSGAWSPMRKALSTRLLTWLGSFSYSIYLIHSIIQGIYLRSSVGVAFLNEPMKQFLILIFGVTPIVLVFSYLFYFAAERPFLNHKKTILITDPGKEKSLAF